MMMEVESEINSSFEYDKAIKPVVNEKNLVSRFRVQCPSRVDEPSQDSDGDYIVSRSATNQETVFLIEHSVSTRLELVALQVWRGALLISDFIIHIRNKLASETVLELGAGVGLSSLVAALYSKEVFCTDLDSGEILPLLRQNIKRNKPLLKGNVAVLGLDWFNLDWGTELKTAVEKSTIILAADVIYDNDVTEAFLRTVTKILSTPPKKTLYLALEKRYVFTINDLDSVAPCYEHLMRCIDEARQKEPWANWTIQPMLIDFPQRLPYDRVKQLVMWQIKT